MKDKKQTVRFIFAIVSFAISIVDFVYAITMSVSVFLEYNSIKNSIGTGGTDFLLLGLISGAVVSVISLIGFVFSILSGVLFRSKSVKIIAFVLACAFIVLFFIGFSLWKIVS